VGEGGKDKGPTHLGFRADAAFTTRLDRLAAAMSKRVRGAEISRSAVMKSAVETALPELELEYLGHVPEWTETQTLEYIEKTLRDLLMVALGRQLDAPWENRKVAEALMGELIERVADRM
jgi:hypothetical protein